MLAIWGGVIEPIKPVQYIRQSYPERVQFPDVVGGVAKGGGQFDHDGPLPEQYSPGTGRTRVGGSRAVEVVDPGPRRWG